MEHSPTNIENDRKLHVRLAWIALLLLVPAPSLGVFIAMMWGPTQGTTPAKVFYFLMKVWILVLPVAWTWWIDRRRFSRDEMRETWATFGWPASGGKAIAAGAMLGLAIAAVIFGAYFVVRDSLIDPEAMRAMATNNGIGTLGSFLLFTAILSTVNAWLEEYVWRWFVFRKCETLVGGRIAIVLSAFLFTFHHILALISQASWQVTALACLGVFIGGCVWSWCFLRYRSIWPGYVSHVIADVAVFTVGYLILFT